MIKDEEFQRISGFMKQRYGIDLSKKKVIVNGRLENYIRGGGFQSFDEFMNAVENDASGNQEKMLVNYLTTNHTYFMREFEHFDFSFPGFCLLRVCIPKDTHLKSPGQNLSNVPT